MDSVGKRKATTASKESPASKNSRPENNGRLSEAVVAALKSTEEKILLMEERIQERIGAVCTQLLDDIGAFERKFTAKLQESIGAIADRIDKVERKCSKLEENSYRITGLSGEINSLREELEALKKEKAVAAHRTTDAVVFGLPFAKEENLRQIFDGVCKSIDFSPPAVCDIFRTKYTAERPNSAVIVKFHSLSDRSRTLSAFSQYRKKHQSPVPVKVAGSDCNFSIYESLSIENRKTLQAAIKLRKHKKLYSAFSRGGEVYIRVSAGSEPVAVPNSSELDKLISQT